MYYDYDPVFDEMEYCEICEKPVDSGQAPCECPECPECGDIGYTECYGGKCSGLSKEKLEWELFTKRTNEPKLSWLMRQLDEAGIAFRQNGESWHAPILEIRNYYHEKAWAILNPVDDIPDDDEQFEIVGRRITGEIVK